MRKINWQLLLNIILCGFFLDFTLHEVHRSLTGEPFRYGLAWYDIYWQFSWFDGDWMISALDISFRTQNTIMALMILFRSYHREVHKNCLHQLVALAAFFSGAMMPGIGDGLKGIGASVAITANLIGIASLFSLNRSFGILIARREIKTKGLYSIVRHPMYNSDILLRVGYVIGYFSWLNLGLVMISSALYVLRARLEEGFLVKTPEYENYMKKVKYRFIPGVY
jgi:protein-S-isoprenylcysteine O-methyltransferase Ste14